MHRACTRCQRTFAPKDLSREDSRSMETERKAAGLTGIRFLYYHCPDCSMNDIFVDILPQPGESQLEFERRRSQMEAVAREMESGDTEAVVQPVTVH